jgi:glutamine synthetase
MSLRPFGDSGTFSHMIAGLLANARAMTVFLNPTEASYSRLGSHKAPGYVSWSAENRSQLVRIPAAAGEYRRAELRSPDPCANPYLAFALMIDAGLHGIESRLPLPERADINLYKAGPQVLAGFDRLPESYAEACSAAMSSDFIRAHIPAEIMTIYCGK